MADKRADDLLEGFASATTEAATITALNAIQTFAVTMGGGANVGANLNKEALFKMAHVKKDELGAAWTSEAAKALGAAAHALSIMCECGEHPATHVCGECDGECESTRCVCSVCVRA